MTDPRHTDPWYDDPPPVNPNLRGKRSNVAMWGWITGIAVVILLAFILAAGWNSNPQTASKAPPATVGSGGATMPPSTTGSGAGMPATAPQNMSPQKPAPSTGPATK